MDLKFIRTLEMRTIETGGDAAAATMDKLATAHKNVSSAAATTATVTETAAKSQKSLRESVDALEKRFNPLIRNQVEFEKVERRLMAAAAAQPELRERANATIAAAARHYDALSQAAVASGKATVDSSKAVAGASNAFTSHAAGARLARHELINLSRQFQDVGVSLASGQSPLTVLVQQGSQIADVFATSSGTIRGFFSQVIGGAARFATSAAGIATGLAGIAGTAGYAAISWTSGQRDIERALSGIGRASGTTREQINQIASASSSAFGLSTSEAAEAATAFAATGKIYTETNAAATLSLKDFSKAMGMDLADATKAMTKALLDPADGAVELNKKLGSLDAATIDYIRSLQAAGNMQGAQKALIDAINPKIKEMAGFTGGLSKAWDLASNAVSNYFTNLGRQAAQGKIAPGITLGAGTQDEQLATARSTLETRRASPFQGSLAQPGIRAAEAEVRRLEDAYTDLQVSMRQVRFDKFENDAAAITKAVIPQIEQLQKLREALSVLNTAQSNKQVTLDQFGPAQKVPDSPAQQSLQLQERTLGDAIDKQQRLTAEVLKTADAYKGMSVEAALILNKQEGQLAIASAVTAAQKLAAQEQATINSHRLEGLSLEERTRIAAGERAIAQAQINAGAQQNLLALRDQFAVASAVTGVERIKAEAAATYAALIRQNVDPQIAAATAAQQELNARTQLNSQVQASLLAMQDQLTIAQASTGAEQIRAQAQATYNSLIRQGVDARLASAAAAQEEEIAVAKVSAAVDRQAKSIEQQTELIYARLKGTEASVKGEQAYQNAIEAGASAASAGAMQAAVLANEAAKATERGAKAAEEWGRRWERNKQLFEELAAKIEFVVGFDNQFDEITGNLFQQRTSSNKMYTKDDGSYSQFNPEGYKSTVRLVDVFQERPRDDARFGPGGFTPPPFRGAGVWLDSGAPVTPNTQGFEFAVNKVLSAGGSYDAAFSKILSEATSVTDTSLGGRRDVLGGGGVLSGGINEASLGLLRRIVDLAPDEQKAGFIERQIALVKQQPVTFAREELLKSLNDQLKSLTDAAGSLEDSMRLQMDPLFSQGHDYLNALKIGYYKAATGLTGIVGGAGSGDVTPVHMMLEPGELLKVIPKGQWHASDLQNSRPAADRLMNGVGSLLNPIRAADGFIGTIAPMPIVNSPASQANDNSKNVTQYNTININGGGDSSQRRLTAKQMAQGFAKAATAAALAS